MWDATGRTRGLLWGGYPLCRQARGCELCAADDTHCRSPSTFTGRPLCSVRKAKDLGMETREVPGFHSRWARGRHRSGACSGSHERAHKAVCDSFHVHPGSQPGACSSTGCCNVCRSQVDHLRQARCKSQVVAWVLRGRLYESTRTSCKRMAHDIRRQVASTSSRVARVESCTAS